MIDNGDWKTALVDIDRATEFSGDDVDQYSKLVDLGGDFGNVRVILPAITSSTVGIMIQEGPNPAEVPMPLYILDDDATGNFLSATTAATTAMVIKFCIGGVRYIRVKCGSNQSADVSFKVRGC